MLDVLGLLEKAFQKAASRERRVNIGRQGSPRAERLYAARLEWWAGRRESLGRELLDRAWRSRRPRRRRLSKPGRRDRIITIPPFEDRVVSGAIARALARVVEPLLPASAHGWVSGRGQGTALAQWREAAENGLLWAGKLDVRGCFDNIPRRRLWALLGRYVEPPVLRVVQAFARAVSPAGEGVGQGYPHGPVLANLYLSPVYRPLQEGLLLGYGDDFPVMADDPHGVESGIDTVAGRITRLGMHSKIVHSPAPCSHVGFLSIALRPTADGGFEPALCDDCIDQLEALPPAERRYREAGLLTYLKGVRAACRPVARA